MVANMEFHMLLKHVSMVAMQLVKNVERVMDQDMYQLHNLQKNVNMEDMLFLKNVRPVRDQVGHLPFYHDLFIINNRMAEELIFLLLKREAIITYFILSLLMKLINKIKLSI